MREKKERKMREKRERLLSKVMRKEEGRRRIRTFSLGFIFNLFLSFLSSKHFLPLKEGRKELMLYIQMPYIYYI